jgi:hypothetical protein
MRFKFVPTPGLLMLVLLLFTALVTRVSAGGYPYP